MCSSSRRPVSPEPGAIAHRAYSPHRFEMSRPYSIIESRPARRVLHLNWPRQLSMWALKRFAVFRRRIDCAIERRAPAGGPVRAVFDHRDRHGTDIVFLFSNSPGFNMRWRAEHD
jgi:hypothetical protein